MSTPMRRWWDETADGVPCREIDRATWADRRADPPTVPQVIRRPRIPGWWVAAGAAFAALATAVCVLSLRVGV